MAKQPLEPLIPLDEFKKLVSAISRVPKEAIEKAKDEQPKHQAKSQLKRKRPTS
jgi:hypothetical protein